MKVSTLIYDKCTNIWNEYIVNSFFAHTIVSIYLDQKTLKVITFEREEGNGVGFSYSKSFLNSDEEMWYMQEGVLEENIALVKKALEDAEYDLAKLEFIITIGALAYIEQIDLPCLAKHELEEAIAWELPQHVPWEKDSYFYQYEIKHHDDGNKAGEESGNLQEIAIYSIPKRQVEVVQNAVQKQSIVLVGFFIAEGILQQKDTLTELINDIDFYESFYNLEDLKEKRNLYFIPILSALVYAQKKTEIDFLSLAEHRSAYLYKYASLYRLIAMIFIGLSFGGIGFAGIYNYNVLNENQQIKNKYLEYLPWQQKMEELATIDKRIQEVEKSITDIEKHKVLWGSQLVTLSNSIPNGCWLLKIEPLPEEKLQNKNCKRMALIGKVENTTILTELVEKLKKTNLYHKVEIIKASKEIDSDGKADIIQDFRVELQLKANSKNVK